MLNNVAKATSKMVRNVVINHPNTANCVCFRKVINRTSAGTVDGKPTMGGMAVIDSYDEENISWNSLGNGYAMLAEHFDPALMMQRGDANNLNGEEFKFLIEPENEGEFILQKDDVFYLIIGLVRLAYEIVFIETVMNIPPYSQRYLCNRRSDLDTSVS